MPVQHLRAVKSTIRNMTAVHNRGIISDKCYGDVCGRLKCYGDICGRLKYYVDVCGGLKCYGGVCGRLKFR